MRSPNYFFVIDRTNGKLLNATPFVTQTSWAKGFDLKTGRPIYNEENRPPNPMDGGGAAAGALLGRIAAGKHDNTLAMLGGALIGGVAGNVLVDRPNEVRTQQNQQATQNAEAQRKLVFKLVASGTLASWCRRCCGRCTTKAWRLRREWLRYNDTRSTSVLRSL